VVHLLQINEPPREYGTPVEIFEATLKHEQFITRSINELMTLAINEQDYATQTFLQWYVTEQVEEEANVNDILAPLRMVGDEKGGLMLIDQQLAKRTAPAPVSPAN
jgi:ferritin